MKGCVKIMSEKGKLNKTDLVKILKGAGLAVAGVVLTYLIDALPKVDLGEYQLIVMGTLTVLLNVVRKVSAGPVASDPRRP